MATSQGGNVGSGGGTWGDPRYSMGSFWQGADGNVWVAGDNGVNSAGAWDDNSSNYWGGIGYTQISDPNSPFIEDRQGFGTVTGGTSTGGTGSSVDQNLLRQGLNTGIANLEGQLQVLDPQRQAAELRVSGQYDTTKGRLTRDYNTGNENLLRSKNQVEESKTRSLSNLRDWLQGMGQGYSNQLGTMGAGNSSAADLINFALGKQGSRERGNILQDAGTQLQGIDSQAQQLQTNYQDSIYDLDKWKENSLYDITTQYQQARDQINNSILDARARAAAEMELTQQAVDYLSQLEQQYRNQATSLANQYSKLTSPNVAVDSRLTSYKNTPVQQATLNALNMPNAVNPESPLAAYYKRRDEEQLSNPLGV